MTASIDFRTPDAGFEAPVEMWLACHQRVYRFTAMLCRLASHVAENGADNDAQMAAASIRRYFNEAAPRHHEDEEQDMFTRLRERVAAGDPALLEMERIEAEHLTMARAWRALDAALADIAAGHAVSIDLALARQFEHSYQKHIEIEETVLLGAMKQHFSEADWQAIGRSMAERRGLEYPQPRQR